MLSWFACIRLQTPALWFLSMVSNYWSHYFIVADILHLFSYMSPEAVANLTLLSNVRQLVQKTHTFLPEANIWVMVGGEAPTWVALYFSPLLLQTAFLWLRVNAAQSYDTKHKNLPQRTNYAAARWGEKEQHAFCSLNPSKFVYEYFWFVYTHIICRYFNI